MSTPYIHRFEPDAAYLSETLVRLGRLYEARGDTSRAAASYQRLIGPWRDADKGFAPRVDAVRARLARLQPAPR